MWDSVQNPATLAPIMDQSYSAAAPPAFTPSTFLALGAGTEALGAIGAGIGGMRAASYNAKVARMQANAAGQAAEQEAAVIRGKARRVVAAQRVAAAASGVAVDVGSPLDAQIDTLTSATLDEMAARQRRANQGWGYEAEARNQEFIGKRTLLTGFMDAKKAVTRGVVNYRLAKAGYNPLAWGV